jgi:hypothetical protein
MNKNVGPYPFFFSLISSLFFGVERGAAPGGGKRLEQAGGAAATA